MAELSIAQKKAIALANARARAAQANKTPTPQAAAQPAAQPASPEAPQPGFLDYLSQGMSGLNEGIANTLGAPVQITTDLMNLGSTGLNKLGANLPMIEHPVGGQDFFRTIMSPTTKPESADPRLQMTRRVGQEVGAWMIPGMGSVSKSARPLATAAKEATAALGSGAGAAVAQQVAPGNPWVEMAGQLIGGMTPGGVARMARRKSTPAISSVEDLRNAKNAAYAAVDSSGVAYAPTAYDRLLTNIVHEAQSQHISPTRHADAASFISDMVGRRGKPLTLTELDQLRQEVRRDLIVPSYGNPAKAADAHFGNLILDQIDSFIAGAKPGDLIGGDPKAGANAILAARSANAQYRKAEAVQDALYRAKLQTDSTGSGGNINNAIRQQFKAILTNPKRRAAFTSAEIAQIESLVRQGRTENLLRYVGKFAPGGNGLIGMLQIGGTVLNPSLAALPVAGMVAKGIADRGTLNKVARLQREISKAPPRKVLPQAPLLPPAILAAQGANQLTGGGGW